MSGPAISPAPPASAGANAVAGAGATAGAGAQTQAHEPLAGFEAVLTALADAQQPGAGGTATTGKLGDSAKNTADGAKGKIKATGDGKAANADPAASATSDSAAPGNGLAIFMVPILHVPLQATPLVETGVEGDTAGSGPAAAGPNIKPAGDTAAAALAQLTPGSVAADAGADKAQVAASSEAVAVAADSFAANANATAKGDAPSTPKVNAAQPAQAAAPEAPSQAPAPAISASEPPPVVAAETVAAALPAAPAMEGQAAGTQAPVGAKDSAAKDGAPKAQAKPNTRVDVTKTANAPAAATGPTVKVADALQPLAASAATDVPEDEKVHEPALEAKTASTDPQQAPADPGTASTTTPATLIHAAAVAVRGAPQTVANLAAQIVKKLEGRTTQFDIQLDPAGLGKVDVRMAIGADGRMSAAMSFDTPQAAAELKSRAGELQRAMEQAGFDVSGGMSFDVASDRGQGHGGQAQNQHADAGAAFRGRAFQAALDTTADNAPPPQLTLRRTALAGVDIRI